MADKKEPTPSRKAEIKKLVEKYLGGDVELDRYVKEQEDNMNKIKDDDDGKKYKVTCKKKT